MEEFHVRGPLQDFDNKKMFYLSKCIHKMKQLGIFGTEIASDELKHLSEAIMNLNEPVCIVFCLPKKKYHLN